MTRVRDLTASAQSQAVAGPRDQHSTSRSGLLSLAGGVAAAGFGFALTIIVTRGLGVTRTGVFFVAVAAFTILSNVAELGADTALIRAIPRLRTQGRASDLRRTLVVAIIPMLLVSIGCAIATYLCAHGLAEVFLGGRQTETGAVFIRTAAPFLAIAPLVTVVLAGTRGFGSVIPLVTIQNVAIPVLRCGFVAALLLAGFEGEREIALAWAVPLALACVVALIFLARQLMLTEAHEIGSDRSTSTWGQLAREFWSFASSRGVAAAIEITLTWLDVLLVGYLASARAAGIYAAASRFITTGTLAQQATRVAIAPRVSRLLTTHDTAGTQRLHRLATQWVITSSWPVYLALACFAPLALRVFGHGFVSGADALTILALAMLVDLGTGNVQTVLLMSGHSGWNMSNKLVCLAVNVTLNLLLIPRFGIKGAAWAWAASILIDNVASTIEVRLLIKVRTFHGTAGFMAVTALACFGLVGLAVRLWWGSSIPALLVYLLVASSLYLSVVWTRRRQLGVRELLASVTQRPRSAETSR